MGGVRRFSPDGTAVGSSPRGAPPASDGLALQRHHHVPTQFLGQGPPILDVVQPVDLPLVLDT